MFDFVLADGHRLRLPEESDAEELYALIEAEREHLAPWLPWAAGQTLDATVAFIRQGRQQFADNDGFHALIVDDRRIIGMVGFHRVDWLHRSTSIGYWLASADQGRGTMTAAVRALVDWALRGWELNRVEIRVAVENRRSRAIPERLGFREEGRLREVERVGERYFDHIVYSMLAEDWGTTTALPSN